MSTALQLSVVIPTYRRGPALARLLELINQQSVRSACEVILVDQNAAGQTRKELGDALLQDVVHLSQEEPNVSLARNAGFLKSHGHYVLFLDDDVLPTPNFFAQLLQLFAMHPSYGCIAPLVYTDSGLDAALAFYQRFLQSPWNNSGMAQRTNTATGIIAFRRDYYLASGGFDPLLFRFARTAEDLELFFRMQSLGMAVWVCKNWQLLHDESQPGGCELRTDSWWQTRARCTCAWALRYLAHGNGRFAWSDRIQFLRSALVNRGVLFAGPKVIFRHAKLMRKAYQKALAFYQQHKDYYALGVRTNHLHWHASLPAPEGLLVSISAKRGEPA